MFVFRDDVWHLFVAGPTFNNLESTKNQAPSIKHQARSVSYSTRLLAPVITTTTIREARH